MCIRDRNKTIPVTTGYSSVKANVGSVRNEGFEVNINSDNIRTKNFSWRTSLNRSLIHIFFGYAL